MWLFIQALYSYIWRQSLQILHQHIEAWTKWRQAITWANVDPVLCRHMASLGHNELEGHHPKTNSPPASPEPRNKESSGGQRRHSGVQHHSSPCGVALNDNETQTLQVPTKPHPHYHCNHSSSTLRGSGMGLLPDTWICGLRMRQECRERFSWPPWVSDPDMHQVRTCRDACRDG